mgnify:CR=1 FL=1
MIEAKNSPWTKTCVYIYSCLFLNVIDASELDKDSPSLIGIFICIFSRLLNLSFIFRIEMVKAIFAKCPSLAKWVILEYRVISLWFATFHEQLNHKLMQSLLFMLEFTFTIPRWCLEALKLTLRTINWGKYKRRGQQCYVYT